uniref:HDC05573 n=1 Tax=Drosophila melanogaster TaxID=7227 RepID=Q6IGR7_DROME|nr:TPA_inf: HDC05573 [Drosophila melanogaster]
MWVGKALSAFPLFSRTRMQQVNQRTPRIKLAPQSTNAVIKWRHPPAAQLLRSSSGTAELRGPCKSTPDPQKWVVGGAGGWLLVGDLINCTLVSRLECPCPCLPLREFEAEEKKNIYEEDQKGEMRHPWTMPEGSITELPVAAKLTQEQPKNYPNADTPCSNPNPNPSALLSVS